MVKLLPSAVGKAKPDASAGVMDLMCSGRIDEERCWRLLKESVGRAAEADGDFETGLDCLKFHRHARTASPVAHFLNPVLIVIIQGAKYVRIGKDGIKYAERDGFLCAVDMPVASCVMEASHERPYLSLSLELDMELIATFSTKILLPEKGAWTPERGAAPFKVSAELLDALLRLSEMANDKERIACLGESILKEVHYLLLKGQAGRILQNLCFLNFPTANIYKIISWIKENYATSFSIWHIAREFGMAQSTLFKYFKEITALSPIQYQKRLRLCEAKRLIEASNYRIAEIAEMVGYGSSTQFSREYKRLFGSAPKKEK